ncbi:murein biosynthesis integral membrane protein MurJ [Exiguobacterium sp. s157]|uniref:murein biosynthesis integral membrane protein MurJ n=1 Tax=Exiguobacterium sp. s157 TaxID=2751233 RepID=UPI001BEA6F49|nr:murein biosynthesis integral membrane protein MurJ [Exiguobacterium sp. s157]
MKRTAILIMVLTFLSQIFGFLRDVVLAYYYGASSITDAYLISMTIPGVLFIIVGAGISTGYIPMYNRVISEYDSKRALLFTNNLINITLIICSIIIVFGLVFTDQIVKVFASGFSGKTLALAVDFTKINLFSLYFVALLYIAKPYLQLHGSYTAPALIALPLSVVTMISTFLSAKMDSIIILALGGVIAAALQLIFLIPLMYKKGYRYSFFFNINEKYTKRLAIITVPLIIGISVDQINKLIDKTLASQIVEGGISALNYAHKIDVFIQMLVVTSISTVLFPQISKLAAEKKYNSLKIYTLKAVNTIALLVIPASVGVIFFSQSIVKFMFGRGEFDNSALEITSDALFYYSIGMIGFGLKQILSEVFYAIQDSKTPMYNGMIGILINIILNFILSRFMGIGGLALATSISALFTTTLLMYSLRKKMGPFGLRLLIFSIIKITLISIFVALIAKIIFIFLLNMFSENVSLIISAVIGVILYFSMVYIGKIDGFNLLINGIVKKIKKKR